MSMVGYNFIHIIQILGTCGSVVLLGAWGLAMGGLQARDRLEAVGGL